MILRNPTDNDLTVQIKGSVYNLPARESISVSEEVGKYWQTLHAFLVVEKEIKQVPVDFDNTENTGNIKKTEKTEKIEKKEEIKEEKEVKEVAKKPNETKNK